MKILLHSLVLILLFNIASYSQQSVAMVWERYGVARDGVSVMLPKMPVRDDKTDRCTELGWSRFYVFAEGVVYELGVYEKLPKNVGYECEGTVTPFGKGTLQKRIEEFTKSDAEVRSQKTKIGGREAIRFASDKWTRVVISEVDNRDRWIELAVHHYPGETPDFDRFLKSFEFSAKDGKEIGDGVVPVITPRVSKFEALPPGPGKVPASTTPGSGSGTGAGNGSGSGSGSLTNGPGSASPAPVRSDPYRAISQPPARYTELARKTEVQGAVRLKITLLANGNVGSVVPVTFLPDGLTEQAMAAAKRIVFLPKRVNGIPVSVVITREYTFTIY
ncbi:MAG: hypothetical protein DMF63_17615 [Acidobacteria bacterium]|nr:MAG: hypothetical protein DMF63_17615 [Acidobacteriota bacterium]